MMKAFAIRLLLACLLMVGLLPGPLGLQLATAAESAPVSSPRVVVTLVSDTDVVALGQPFRVGLRMRLAPGWHTYWRNPGDAGMPPEMRLDLSDGAAATEIDWPTPRRVSEGPVMTYAYTGEILLPVSVTPSAASASSGSAPAGSSSPSDSAAPPGASATSDAVPFTLVAHANWLVCKEICVPEEGEFRLTLPAGKAVPSAQAALFAAHDRMVPRASPWQATISPSGVLFVQGPELNPTAVVDAWFIPSDPERIQDDAAQPLSVRAGGFVLALKPAPGFKADAALDGVLSVRDRAGLQTDVVVHAEPGFTPGPAPAPLSKILLLAFMGGVILNLMPCVFPVLAIKAVGLAQGAALGHARAHALSYTAGVLVTFVALAAALLAARQAGTAAGWGFQFQSPVFVAAMAWLLFAVGLNLSGVFELGTKFSGAGGQLAARSGHVGSFFTGLLAVLVATPCTAPFMGVAIAAGLAAPPSVTVAVFLAMGLGLAAPYVALAALPGVGRLMPRPGPWMVLLKQGLAFPMYGAAAWLLWVVSQEAGPSGVLGVSVGFVLLGFAGWVLGATRGVGERSRRFGHATVAAAILAALAVLGGIAAAPPPGIAAKGDAEAFSSERLAAARAQGRPVFVNMTAAWCVTCLVNERVAIGSQAVKTAFADRRVVYLKGDWTRQDPAISEYLRENGRDGVPLYVFYPADGRAPSVLPQILTENTVLTALDKG